MLNVDHYENIPICLIRFNGFLSNCFYRFNFTNKSNEALRLKWTIFYCLWIVYFPKHITLKHSFIHKNKRIHLTMHRMMTTQMLWPPARYICFFTSPNGFLLGWLVHRFNKTKFKFVSQSIWKAMRPCNLHLFTRKINIFSIFLWLTEDEIHTFYEIYSNTSVRNANGNITMEMFNWKQTGISNSRATKTNSFKILRFCKRTKIQHLKACCTCRWSVR